MLIDRLATSKGRVIAGPLLITPRVFADERGFFFESWNERRFREGLIAHGVSERESQTLRFRQDNHSRSRRGVLRGLHFQLPPEPQGKLVRCSVGQIFDVVVDLRRSSETYGQWLGVTLTAETHQHRGVPAGFAHGFLTVSEVAEVQYKASGFWNPSCERSLRWNDASVAVQWPFEDAGIGEPLLAAKDAEAPVLASLEAVDEVFP